MDNPRDKQSGQLAWDHVFSGKRVIITGGCGFIGSHLAEQLVSCNADVTLVDSLIPEYGGNLFNIGRIRDRVHLNISDVRDEHSMRYLIQGMDYLFNLAGQTSHMDSMSDPQTDLAINSAAQLSILEACRRFNPNIRLVFASTRQIYGKPDYVPVDEKHPLRPVDVNGINKLAGEQYHLLYGRIHGIHTCVLRLTNTYGPHMRIKDARQTFVGVWIRNIIEGKTFDVWGGGQKRDFTYVSDAVDAFLRAAALPEADGETFNLGGLEVVTLRELADTLVAAAGEGHYEMREFPADRRQIDIGDYYADDKLIRERLAWQPRVSLKDGLRKTVEFYRQWGSNYL
jgi:UDP-glucose 4-epimerase